MNKNVLFAMLIVLFGIQENQAQQTASQQKLTISMEKRKAADSGNGVIISNEIQEWNPGETAIVICDMWDQHCMNIVFKANYAKFSQHPDLEKELRVTDNRIIVEASPTDKIWGIGMHETDPDVEDITKWRGLNLLGQAIMNVRAVLRYELYNA